MKLALCITGGIVMVILGAAVFTASIYVLASGPGPTHDLSGWEAVEVAWGIIGVMLGPCLMAGGVMLGIAGKML